MRRRKPPRPQANADEAELKSLERSKALAALLSDGGLSDHALARKLHIAAWHQADAFTAQAAYALFRCAESPNLNTRADALRALWQLTANATGARLLASAGVSYMLSEALAAILESCSAWPCTSEISAEQSAVLAHLEACVAAVRNLCAWDRTHAAVVSEEGILHGLVRVIELDLAAVERRARARPSAATRRDALLVLWKLSADAKATHIHLLCDLGVPSKVPSLLRAMPPPLMSEEERGGSSTAGTRVVADQLTDRAYDAADDDEDASRPSRNEREGDELSEFGSEAEAEAAEAEADASCGHAALALACNLACDEGAARDMLDAGIVHALLPALPPALPLSSTAVRLPLQTLRNVCLVNGRRLAKGAFKAGALPPVMAVMAGAGAHEQPAGLTAGGALPRALSPALVHASWSLRALAGTSEGLEACVRGGVLLPRLLCIIERCASVPPSAAPPVPPSVCAILLETTCLCLDATLADEAERHASDCAAERSAWRRRVPAGADRLDRLLARAAEAADEAAADEAAADEAAAVDEAADEGIHRRLASASPVDVLGAELVRETAAAVLSDQARAPNYQFFYKPPPPSAEPADVASLLPCLHRLTMSLVGGAHGGAPPAAVVVAHALRLLRVCLAHYAAEPPPPPSTPHPWHDAAASAPLGARLLAMLGDDDAAECHHDAAACVGLLAMHAPLAVALVDAGAIEAVVARMPPPPKHFAPEARVASPRLQLLAALRQLLTRTLTRIPAASSALTVASLAARAAAASAPAAGDDAAGAGGRLLLACFQAGVSDRDPAARPIGSSPATAAAVATRGSRHASDADAPSHSGGARGGATLRTGTITRVAGEKLGMDLAVAVDATGIRIDAVYEGYAAHRSELELRAGDVLVSVNGRRLAGLARADVIRLLGQAVGQVEVQVDGSALMVDDEPIGVPMGASPEIATLAAASAGASEGKGKDLSAPDQATCEAALLLDVLVEGSAAVETAAFRLGLTGSLAEVVADALLREPGGASRLGADPQADPRAEATTPWALRSLARMS